VDEEICRLENYLDLEKLRMENRFNYTMEIDAALKSPRLFIPSMILQPFIENAIWHGISTMGEKGEIHIRISRACEHSLNVIIEDNGIGVNHLTKKTHLAKSHDSLGIEMTKKRLSLLGEKMGIKTSITYEEKDPGKEYPGTRVSLIVPLTIDKTVF
jgi:sensor histidine kinase YesM